MPPGVRVGVACGGVCTTLRVCVRFGEGVGNGVNVTDGRGVAEGNGGKVGHGVAVDVGTGSSVSLGTGVRVGVRLGRGVRVMLGVGVWLSVSVGDGVADGVRVPVGVVLGVRVTLAVCVGVRLGGVSNAISVASSVGENTTVGVLGASMCSEQPAISAHPTSNNPAPKSVLRVIFPAYPLSRNRSAKGGQALRSRTPGRWLGVTLSVCQLPQRGFWRMSTTSTLSRIPKAALSVSKSAPCSLMVI